MYLCVCVLYTSEVVWYIVVLYDDWLTAVVYCVNWFCLILLCAFSFETAPLFRCVGNWSQRMEFHVCMCRYAGEYVLRMCRYVCEYVVCVAMRVNMCVWKYFVIPREFCLRNSWSMYSLSFRFFQCSYFSQVLLQILLQTIVI